MESGNEGVISGENSIEQKPDTRICLVQRISDGMKECEEDGSQRKNEAIEKKCRTWRHVLLHNDA